MHISILKGSLVVLKAERAQRYIGWIEDGFAWHEVARGIRIWIALCTPCDGSLETTGLLSRCLMEMRPEATYVLSAAAESTDLCPAPWCRGPRVQEFNTQKHKKQSTKNCKAYEPQKHGMKVKLDHGMMLQTKPVHMERKCMLDASLPFASSSTTNYRPMTNVEYIKVVLSSKAIW